MRAKPSRVVILSKVYTVEYSDIPEYGAINPEAGVIQIRKNLRPPERIETLLHEVLHGISEDLNLGMREDLISRLSPVLMDTLLRNNWIAIHE